MMQTKTRKSRHNIIYFNQIATTPWLILVLALLISIPAQAKNNLVSPEDPSQSITYWKPHTLNAQSDQLVAQAEDIFQVLLRVWDQSRIEPSLYVVKSNAGPWAASLADGNILLSRAAIKTCMSFGQHRGKHLLAFVLSHELAHQRADDLWHQKFFRLAGSQAPEIQKKMFRGLDIDRDKITDLEQREAQADHDGLLIMSSVGFDPYQIVDKKDFFTDWVENIWDNSCRQTNSSKTQNALAQACKQAQTRALRARTQLSAVATQSSLYDLGLQAFTAGNYTQARRYFKAYGRQYPSRAVYTSLGLSHLAESLSSYNQQQIVNTQTQPAIYFPLVMDANPTAQQAIKSSNSGKRGTFSKQQQQRLDQQLEKSISYFEKAIKIEPDTARSYLLQAVAYLVNNNTFMARGVLQGKYIPKFGNDAAVKLVLAITRTLENKLGTAKLEYSQLIKQLHKQPQNDKTTIPSALLKFAAYYNLSAIHQHQKSPKKAKALWKDLAKHAKTTGNSVLFRLALNQLKPITASDSRIKQHPQVKSMRLGDKIATNIGNMANTSDLWLEGEQMRILRYDDGARLIVDMQNKIISAWQEASDNSQAHAIAIGDKADRPLKTYGIPSRRLQTIKGEYLAYDNYGIAIHIMNNEVSGWFLYNPS